ncbi:hypothetical protein UlMin_003313 [Ulmus minor]
MFLGVIDSKNVQYFLINSLELTFSSNENYVQITVREALNTALDEEMSADPKVGEYQGAYKISKGLLDKYGPDRVVDTPITEAIHDHIINSDTKSNYMSASQISVHIIFRGPNGAATGVGAQHSQCYAAWYASCPGLKVLTPSSSEDARGLLKAAIRDPDPVVFLENELLYGESFLVSAEIEREGKDVTITAFSKMVGYALKTSFITINYAIRKSLYFVYPFAAYNRFAWRRVESSLTLVDRRSGSVVVVESEVVRTPNIRMNKRKRYRLNGSALIKGKSGLFS